MVSGFCVCGCRAVEYECMNDYYYVDSKRLDDCREQDLGKSTEYRLELDTTKFEVQDIPQIEVHSFYYTR